MGYSQTELDDAQARWNLTFPPDLIDLLRQRRKPIDRPGAFDWTKTDPDIISAYVDSPFQGFWFDVQHANVWWPEWGDKPTDADHLYERMHEIYTAAPNLIPLFGHRYLPEEPAERGNPVFSVYQTDIIHYGANLDDWMARELSEHDTRPWPTLKPVRFWSRAVEINNEPPPTAPR